MKKQTGYLSAAILSLGLFFTACKKTETAAATDTTAEYKVESDDQSRFTNETDAVANDANAAVENMGGTYGGETPQNPLLPQLCDVVTVIDTLSTPKTITLTYNGSNCTGFRSRTGVVVISFSGGFRWRNPNSSFTVTYQNLKITRVTDNKSITLNGSTTVTNVSGGRLRSLSAGGTIVHTVTSPGMSITFDDGTQRSWQIAKRRAFTYNNGIVITITGIAPAGGGIAEWGTNRYNRAFTNAITQSLVIKQSCLFRLVSGQTQHTVPAGTITTTFGLDSTGTPVSTCPVGPFYFKSVWAITNGNTYTFIAPY